MDNNKSAGGIGFGGLLQIAFIVLKLCKVINWSWWWVLLALAAPTWIGLVIVVVCFILLWILIKKEEENE